MNLGSSSHFACSGCARPTSHKSGLCSSCRKTPCKLCGKPSEKVEHKRCRRAVRIEAGRAVGRI